MLLNKCPDKGVAQSGKRSSAGVIKDDYCRGMVGSVVAAVCLHCYLYAIDCEEKYLLCMMLVY